MPAFLLSISRLGFISLKVVGHIMISSFFLFFHQVALKFEHRNSKGCNYGPPYEWQVYKYV